jgi:general secretion pathway protein L
MHRELERTLDRAYAAVNWWLEGLWIGLPPRLRKRLFAERAEFVVRLAGNTVSVGLAHAEAVTVDTRGTDAKAAVARLVSHAQATDVTLVLPRDSVLTRRLRLPAAAEAELRSALKHELDRLTPFAMDELAFDFRIRERTESALLLDVALLPRTALERAVEEIGRLGLRPATATAEDEHGERLALNLLPRRRQLRLRAAAPLFRPRLALCAALLTVLALYLPLPRYDSLRAAHAAAVETTRAQAVAARQQLASVQLALASGEFLAQRREHYVPPVALLLELTAKMPDDTWLSRLSMSRGEVHLQGESSAATELLQLLESTDVLRDVRFQAPVSRGEKSGKEQFTILAKLARGAP